ncbi:MAG: vWA domain-containing protein [Thermoguttaceae bacterium]
MGANMLLLAQDATRVTFEWGRIQTNSDWILPIVAMLLIALFVRAMYTRDAQELPHWIGLLLTGLRTAAFLGLLVLYLQPQWRTEHETIRNSRVLLLVDSSSSMGLTDADPSSTRGESRAHQIAQAMAQNAFLQSLRKTHDIVVMRFDEDLGRIVSLDKSPLPTPQLASTDPAAATQDTAKVKPDPRVDWEKALSPVGKETRLGQALRQLIYEERNSPVSGIVVFSDGGQNAGLSPEAAISLAQEAKIPIYTVGVGSDQLPMHVRVYKLETLPRAYPGDPYTITGLIQAQDPSRKLDGKPVTVQLLTRKAGEKAAPGSGTLVDSRQVILGGDGESVPVKFEITP